LRGLPCCTEIPGLRDGTWGARPLPSWYNVLIIYNFKGRRKTELEFWSLTA
jgi:hypothetical protein